MFCFVFLFHFEGATWFKCKILSLYSGSEGIEYSSRHLLSWLMYLLPFLSPAICLKILPPIAHRLPLLTSFSSHYSLFITPHHEIGRVCSMYRERLCVHKVLMGKPEGKRSLGRPGLRWEANIKMDQEIGRKGDLNLIYQTRDKYSSVFIKFGELIFKVFALCT